MKLALTYHVEGPRERPSAEIYEEIAEQVLLADSLGYDYAWFAEHHAHVHVGHMPCPLLFALHLTARTRRIACGTAVICLNMHRALEMAEEVAVADWLSGGRISPGFGSGSTPEELALYDLPAQVSAEERHAAFEQSLETIRAAWEGRHPRDPAGAGPLPVARPDLLSRSWLAANSIEAAGIAGRGGHNVMFSYLRTAEQYAALRDAYLSAGGRGHVAANRPVYVGETDAAAWEEAEPALRTLWRRFQAEGKIARDAREPERFDDDSVPGQFVVGSAESVAGRLAALHARAPFDTINLEPRWRDLPPPLVRASIERFAADVAPRLRALVAGR